MGGHVDQLFQFRATHCNAVVQAVLGEIAARPN